MEREKFEVLLNDIKAHNDLASVASRYLKVEKRGRYYWCKCPFHGDKNPSLCISDDEMFYCYGCHVGGDVIKFVMLIESVEFVDAIKLLASWANIEFPDLSTKGGGSDANFAERKKKKDRILSLLKETAMFYHENLKKPAASIALEYMKKRQLSDGLARHFGLGFADGYDSLPIYLKKLGYTEEELIESGVCKQKEGRKPYDALANRLIFPIIDIYGNVIAFGGRLLEDNVDFAKYLNTADTMVFNKKNTLYAINYLKKQRQKGPIPYVIVVEGYMDTISLHKAGFTMAVASMGTALTFEQAKLIKRFANKVYICYDGDSAGHAATMRGLDILRDSGLDVMVVQMPDKYDPDDVIKVYGKEGYQKLLDEAMPLVEYKFFIIKSKYDLNSVDGRVKYLSDALDILASIDDSVERELYIPLASKTSKTNVDFLKKELDKKIEGKFNETELKNAFNVTKTVAVNEEFEVSPIIDKAEKYILYSLIHKKPYAYFKNDARHLFFGKYREIYVQIKTALNENPGVNLKDMLYNDYLDSTGDGSIIADITNFGARSAENESDEKKYYEDCLWVLYKNWVESKITELTAKYSAEIDIEKRKQISEKINEYTKILKNKKVDEL